MITSWKNWGSQLALASCVIVGGAIASANCAFAQITPDGTLPNNSRVTTQDNMRIIEGGTQAGSNLFHSFGEFSVPTGGTAFFNNALDIQNIISRVTGGSVSNIDGLIRARGTANLFLLNPNGIIFGPNAQLRISGSFLASTASSLKFADGTEFSANAPQTKPLLTISVPIGLQYGGIANKIYVQGADLAVKPGKMLALLGGEVNLDGGNLQAPGGRVELGGSSGEGTVGLNFTDNNNLSLSFPDSVVRTDVSLANGAKVDVRAGGGGSIAINARNLNISGGSLLVAGIGQRLGSADVQAGDITLNATEEIRIRQGSWIQNDVFSNATGNSGNLLVTTESLFVTDGSRLSASTYGQGNAGNIIIDAGDRVSFDGTRSAVVSRVEENGRGIGGNIRITTNSLSVTNGGRLNARTNGQGDAGNIIVNARDISFDGRSRDGIPSAALSGVEENGRGMGGDIRITTNSLSVTNGARLTATTLGKGNAGNIIIDARDRVSFDGTGTSSDGKKVSSTATSRVEENGRGMGGDIRITANSLSVTNGGSLNANTNGQGNAGNIIIDARDVSFDGTSSDGKLASIALSRVEKNGRGMGGDIRITANSLSVINGASLNANTNGQGNAGNIIIDVRDVSFDGRSRDGVASAAISSVAKNGRGKGGNIHITPNSLSVTNGAGLFASTDSQGDAGSVIINARDRVSFDGTSSSGFTSAVASTVESGAVGKGGSINITTAGSLSLTNGAELSSSSFGEGIAGDVQLTAGSIDLNQGAIRSITGSGDGGNITLSVQDILLLRHGSRISATAGTAQQDGDGGNITINAPNGFIVGGTRENNDITANAFSGSGGRVTINATGIFGMTVRTREDLVRLLGTNLDPQRLPTNDITAISQTSPSLSGTVTVNTPDVDPNSGLVNLPAVPVDTQVAQSCTAGSSIAKSQFTITGRGGLPPNPGEALNTDAVQVDLVTLNPEVAQPSTTAVSTNPTSPTPARIVEATGWVIDADGNVVLTANASTVTPHNSWQRTADCRAFNQQPGG